MLALRYIGTWRETLDGEWAQGTPSVNSGLVTMSEVDAHTPARRRIPRPRDLMRVRHPDYLSDTRVDDVARFPKATFEYHLDTLTNRKQEYQFEHFCRKLAEKRIYPNLRVVCISIRLVGACRLLFGVVESAAIFCSIAAKHCERASVLASCISIQPAATDGGNRFLSGVGIW